MNTLSAERQSLIHGIGHVHWHIFLLLEILGQDMTDQDWEEKLTSTPFVAVVDSKSLFDCMNKLVCTFSQVDDKRTAIDIAILKDDLCRTGGHLRRIEGTNMIADPLTKKMNADFLRGDCNKGYWALNSKGHDQLLKEHDLIFLVKRRQGDVPWDAVHRTLQL